jgi:hypothetical protein
LLDPLAPMFLLLLCAIGPLDAFLALRDLLATVRERRLHRRLRRWVRTCEICRRKPGHLGARRWVRHLPACPASPDTAGQAGTPDRGRRDDPSLPLPVTSAAPISTRQRVRL